MATTQDYIEAAVTAIAGGSGGAPTGSLAAFAGTTVPSGWLLCNGANVSRTTYAKLFAAIGTKWGTGNGSTTFTLPNCNGRFLEGTTTTSNVGTYVSAGLPNITGTFSGNQGYNCTGAFTAGSAAFSKTMNAAWNEYQNRVYSLQASNVSSIYSSSSTVQPPAVYVLMIIKV